MKITVTVKASVEITITDSFSVRDSMLNITETAARLACRKVEAVAREQGWHALAPTALLITVEPEKYDVDIDQREAKPA